MATLATRRLLREYQNIIKQNSPVYTAKPSRQNQLFEWHFTIRGPPSTPYEGGLYHGIITFPSDYPYKPPSIFFLNVHIYHLSYILIEERKILNSIKDLYEFYEFPSIILATSMDSVQYTSGHNFFYGYRIRACECWGNQGFKRGKAILGQVVSQIQMLNLRVRDDMYENECRQIFKFLPDTEQSIKYKVQCSLPQFDMKPKVTENKEKERQEEKQKINEDQEVKDEEEEEKKEADEDNGLMEELKEQNIQPHDQDQETKQVSKNLYNETKQNQQPSTPKFGMNQQNEIKEQSHQSIQLNKIQSRDQDFKKQQQNYLEQSFRKLKFELNKSLKEQQEQARKLKAKIRMILQQDKMSTMIKNSRACSQTQIKEARRVYKSMQSKLLKRVDEKQTQMKQIFYGAITIFLVIFAYCTLTYLR